MKIEKINKINFQDFVAFIFLLLAYIPSLFLHLRKPNIWLVCERRYHAEDNGWIFYHWLRENHPEQEAFFILDKKASNFNTNNSHFIHWGSFRHYIYYLASKTLIKATFDTPYPESRMCSIFDDVFHIHRKKAYIRHGISKDGCEHHNYKYLGADLFLCGAKPEYDYFMQNAGYPEGYLQYTGFARFDDLINNNQDGRYILIAPTWRRYLCESTHNEENNKCFLQSQYYKTYSKLLENDDLLNFAKTNNLKIKFCLHAEFRRFQNFFKINSPILEIVNNDESIHELLLGASILITDYSSMFFDIAYMYKPIVYLHFDYDEFRKRHLSEGYFNYARDGFGDIVSNTSDLIEKIKGCYNDGKFIMPEKFKKRVDIFFTRRDTNNCERIFQAIKVMESRKH